MGQHYISQAIPYEVTDLKAPSVSSLPPETGFALYSPAKLNLGLHVLNKRSDGYHNLHSRIQLIDLFDRVQMAPRLDDKLILHSKGDMARALPQDERNLVLAAAKMLQLEQRRERKVGADIQLCKQIPSGAGLGGGSGNAAAVLLGLNHLWQTGLSRAKLQNLGLLLGTDVPFFLLGQSAFAHGVGDQLLPLDSPMDWYVLVFPPVHHSTAEFFAEISASKRRRRSKLTDYANQPKSNDFLRLARKKSPIFEQCYQLFHKATPNVCMTGTGSALFATFAKQESAESVRHLLKDDLRTKVVQASTASSLYTQADKTGKIWPLYTATGV